MSSVLLWRIDSSLSYYCNHLFLKMAPLAPTKISTKKGKTKKQNDLKVTPLAPTKIRTQNEKAKKQNVEPDSESSSSSAEEDEDEGGRLHGF